MDLKIIETGDGGDAVLTGNDFEMIDGFQNMPYIGMFGGNPGHPTKEFLENEQRFDYWANSLVYQNEGNIQFNSLTEKLLSEISLTSASRLKIQETVKKDLKFMNDFSVIDVSVSIVGVDKVSIYIKINELSNVEQKEFVYLWDSTKQELINKNV